MREKYEKELETEHSSRNIYVRPMFRYRWELQLLKHYFGTIYDQLRIKMEWLYHSEIHVTESVEVVEGLEKYNITYFQYVQTFMANHLCS